MSFFMFVCDVVNKLLWQATGC